MSCDDVDRLRTQSPRSSSAAWPPEALRHLEGCERCSRLQTLLDNSAQVDFPEALQDRIEAAILPRLRPVSPLPTAAHVTMALLLCSIGLAAAANWRLGVAGWHRPQRLAGVRGFQSAGYLCFRPRKPAGSRDVAGFASQICVALPRATLTCPAGHRRPAVWISLEPGLPAPGVLLLGNRSYVCSLVRATILARLAKRPFTLPCEPRRDDGTPGGARGRCRARNLLPLSGSSPHYRGAHRSCGHIHPGRRRGGPDRKQKAEPPNVTSLRPDPNQSYERIFL